MPPEGGYGGPTVGAPAPFDLKWVLNALLSAANPVIVGVFDALGNRMPAMDVAARRGYVDVIDRAGRLVGIVYGEAAQLQQGNLGDAHYNPDNALQTSGFLMVWDPAAGDWNRVREGSQIGVVQVEDLGTHTNPERWLHEYHWDCDEVTIAAVGVGGQQNLGAVVGAGLMRRIREITIRHAGTNNTVVTLLIAAGATRLTIDVPAQSTVVWSSQDGREFAAAQQPAVQTSDVTGGSTFVSASGVEHAP